VKKSIKYSLWSPKEMTPRGEEINFWGEDFIPYYLHPASLNMGPPLAETTYHAPHNKVVDIIVSILL
jgi:hypothetical protein